MWTESSFLPATSMSGDSNGQSTRTGATSGPHHHRHGVVEYLTNYWNIVMSAATRFTIGAKPDVRSSESKASLTSTYFLLIMSITAKLCENRLHMLGHLCVWLEIFNAKISALFAKTETSSSRWNHRCLYFTSHRYRTYRQSHTFTSLGHSF